MNCLEAQNGEYNSAGIDSCEGIGYGDNENISDTILLRRIVRAKTDDGPKGKTKGIKNLIGCIKPHSRL
jgi:hypothetical protein